MRNSWKAELALLVLPLLSIFPSCGSSQSTSNPTGPESAPGVTADFTGAVQKVLPAVVEIEVTFGSQGAIGDPTARAGAGTGWVIRQDGVIVTNDHVVDGAQSITIITSDGKRHSAGTVKMNRSKDLAIVTIAGSNLPTATLGDSAQLKLGQPVAAIGNALNMGIRVTSGVVSQLNVPVSYAGINLTGLIETDAAINPGNSGGVLIDLAGNVVGIPNAGLLDSALDAENFGYAITSNEADPVLNNLMSQL